MALDRYALAGRIRELLDPELAGAGFELLEVRVYRGGGRLQVRVYVDAPGGIDLEGCARASRTVDPLLEESGLIEDRYVIEVSSPGVRRPLRQPEQFRQHLGETVELRGGAPDHTWRLRGVLLAADEQGVTIRPLAGARPAVDAAEADPEVEQDEEAEEAAATAGATGEAAPEAAPDPVATAPGDEAAPRTVAHADILEADLEPQFDPQALIQADRRRRKLERRQERQQRQERRERPRRRPRRQGPAGDA